MQTWHPAPVPAAPPPHPVATSSPAAAVVQAWLAARYPSPTTISLAEAARVFGLPRHVLYRWARGTPHNGLPIIRLSDHHWRVSPHAFAEWLVRTGAWAPGPIEKGERP